MGSQQALKRAMDEIERQMCASAEYAAVIGAVSQVKAVAVYGVACGCAMALAEIYAALGDTGQHDRFREAQKMYARQQYRYRRVAELNMSGQSGGPSEADYHRRLGDDSS